MVTSEVLEIHLEEYGQHSWWKALLNTVAGNSGSAQFRLVARRPSHNHHEDCAIRLADGTTGRVYKRRS